MGRMYLSDLGAKYPDQVGGHLLVACKTPMLVEVRCGAPLMAHWLPFPERSAIGRRLYALAAVLARAGHSCLSSMPFSVRDISSVSSCSTSRAQSPQLSSLLVCLQILELPRELPDRPVLEQLIWDLPLHLVDWIDEKALYCAVLQVCCCQPLLRK